MTPFKLLLQLSGLSQREAAELLNVSPSTVDKFSRGVRTAAPGIIYELRELIEKQDIAAIEALDLIDEKGADNIEIGYPSDDYEAQSLGWPCVGAWGGMAARVIAGTNATVALIPRGSTPASAAAADAHGEAIIPGSEIVASPRTQKSRQIAVTLSPAVFKQLSKAADASGASLERYIGRLISITVGPSESDFQNPISDDKIEFIRKFRGKMSVQAIAEHLGIAKTTVYNHMRKMGRDETNEDGGE